MSIISLLAKAVQIAQIMCVPVDARPKNIIFHDGEWN